MTVSQLAIPEMKENKSTTPAPEFEDKTDIETQIKDLAEQYALNQSVSNIIMKKYRRLIKKRDAMIIVLFIALIILFSSCVVGYYDMTYPKYELTKINNIAKE